MKDQREMEHGGRSAARRRRRGDEGMVGEDQKGERSSSGVERMLRSLEHMKLGKMKNKLEFYFYLFFIFLTNFVNIIWNG